MDEFLVAFTTVSGIGPVRTKLLVDFFGSVKKAWSASEIDLIKTGLPKPYIKELLLQRQKLDLPKYLKDLENKNIYWITINDSRYPENLKNIVDPPLVLFVKSNLEHNLPLVKENEKVIGVVGTRKMSLYGAQVTRTLVTDLVKEGFTIVSGMALGVDGVAHGTTLNNGGKTIAVLGTSVDVIYPPAHRELYFRILESGGIIISEVAPGMTVNKGMFPARNRIISGLCQSVLITEGALNSGSLITARLALEQGREVFAVPGPINSETAEGTNYLLKNGAKLVTSIQDILDGS